MKVLGVLPEEHESLATNGVMTSPNYLRNYPNDLHQQKTIQVAEGNIINMITNVRTQCSSLDQQTYSYQYILTFIRSNVKK